MLNCFKKPNAPLPDTSHREPAPVVTGPVEVPAIPPPNPILKAPYAHLDPTHIVPSVPLQLILNYRDAHPGLFPNDKVITICDYSQHSLKKRLYLIDMVSGEVETHCVAHGKNSDPDDDGFATTFSNVPGSECSSLGFWKSGEIYDGTHPHEMKLDGLSPSNSNMRARSVVFHPCNYIVDFKPTRNGRSWGCLAHDPKYSRAMVDRLANGSLGLNWHPSFKP